MSTNLEIYKEEEEENLSLFSYIYIKNNKNNNIIKMLNFVSKKKKLKNT